MNNCSKWMALLALCLGGFMHPVNAQNTILYGMTPNGGTDSLGAIFSFNPATNTETLLYSFKSDSDGQQPNGDLVYCPYNGLLYGLTTSGGVYGGGAVITFNPATNAEARVWSFGHGNAPYAPYGNLVYDSVTGLFYGMSYEGGPNNTGSVFSFNPATDSAKELWHFGFAPTAGLPYGNLVLNPNNGRYYGLTQSGGTYNDGAIVVLNAATDSVSRVYNFDDAPGGEIPYGSLVWYSPNNLFYGVTTSGGTDSMGVIFSFNPVDSVETPLHNFGFGNDAASPQGNLIFDQGKGLFYGLAVSGGINGQGAIFSFNPNSNDEALAYSFGNTPTDGQFPNGSLMYDAANDLYYGMAQAGGINQQGTLFSFNAANNFENTLWSFGSGFDAAQPTGTLLLFNGHTAGINSITGAYHLAVYPNPGNGNFILQSQNATGAAYSISNTSGQLIATGEIDSNHQNINLPGAAPGMYVLMLHGSSGNVPVRFAVVK